jgi:hypothetical protein
MRKAVWRVFGLLLLALAFMSLARAGNVVTITLDPNFPGDYHTYSYTVAGVTYQEYTGPYPAILTGGIYGTGTAVYLACFDINVETPVGTTYPGSLTPPAVLTGNLPQNVDPNTQLEAAWLMNQLSLLGGYYAPVSTSGPISMAIWQIEDPTSIDPAPFVEDPKAQPWVTAAINAVNNGWNAADASQHPYWSPDPGLSVQRFGIVELVDNSPEPGSFALVGGSLIGVGLLLRKRLASN